MACNASARNLWHGEIQALTNQRLVSLLGPGTAATEPAFAGVQWEVLKNAALDHFVPVLVRPMGNLSGREMRLRMERSHGGAGTYIASVLER